MSKINTVNKTKTNTDNKTKTNTVNKTKTNTDMDFITEMALNGMEVKFENHQDRKSIYPKEIHQYVYKHRYGQPNSIHMSSGWKFGSKTPFYFQSLSEYWPTENRWERILIEMFPPMIYQDVFHFGYEPEIYYFGRQSKMIHGGCQMVITMIKIPDFKYMEELKKELYHRNCLDILKKANYKINYVSMCPKCK